MTELSRPVALDRIGPQGLEIVVEAEAGELPAVTARLQVPAVAGLRCRFQLRRAGPDVVSAEGVITGRVTRTCVITLDEFEQEVAESFAVEFVPAGAEAEDDDPESVDQIPYTGRSIDLGEAAVEQLALALDPYPHRPGAEEAARSAEEATGPFAALAAMRPKQ